jgi:hypothetical protein
MYSAFTFLNPQGYNRCITGLVAATVKLLYHIQDMLGLNLGWDTDYYD